MFHRVKLIAVFGGLAAGVGLVGVTPAYAASGGAQQTTHESFDATGIAFTCGSTVLTAIDGTADQVMHTGLDNTGVFHYTGTLTVHDLTAADSEGNQYTITGASWFGGKGTEQQQQIETDTDHFVIRGADGGVYGKVQIVDHFTLNGGEFVFDIGGCEPPPEDEN